MRRTLYIVRHGEGEHNINNLKTISDPSLTERGRLQCAVLSNNFGCHAEIDLVLASPLRRTIETATLAFAPALSKPNVSLMLVPMAQEISDWPCDIGRARIGFEKSLIEIVENRCNLAQIVLDEVGEDWNSKIAYWAPHPDAIKRRAADLRNWLFCRAEATIVLVTHGGFAHYLTEDWTDFDISKGTGYSNCELRKYGFTRDSRRDSAHLEPENMRLIPVDPEIVDEAAVVV